MILVIVESPVKANTIGHFLSDDFEVVASYGHVRDLPKSKLGIDIENNFTPHYIIPVKARKKVNELKKLAKESNDIILALDEDREGEAIAWHITQILNSGEIKNQKGPYGEELSAPAKIKNVLVTMVLIDRAND